MSFELWLIAPVSAILSLILGVVLYNYVSTKDPGTDRMKQIAGWIQDGSRAFLKTEYTYLGVFVIIMAVILSAALGFKIGITYIFGTVLSAIAGIIGMEVAVKANVRTANAAKNGGLIAAFPVAFRGGAVMGLMVVGLALFGISIIYWITGDPEAVLGMSIGASTLTLFMKAGGGIYTKTADIAADLVGKVELSIPEDDPRNPAVIADNVGDNVGDCAGSGADLFDSYVAAIMAAMILGGTMQIAYLQSLPLIFADAVDDNVTVTGGLPVGGRPTKVRPTQYHDFSFSAQFVRQPVSSGCGLGIYTDADYIGFTRYLDPGFPAD